MDATGIDGFELTWTGEHEQACVVGFRRASTFQPWVLTLVNGDQAVVLHPSEEDLILIVGHLAVHSEFKLKDINYQFPVPRNLLSLVCESFNKTFRGAA